MDRHLLLHAYRLMYSAKIMAETYEAARQITKYVHSTSRGHEAIQLATAFNLKPNDWVSPYYRDESLLLGMGWEPYELMLQLLTKADDPFTGGRSYYSHPNSNEKDKPKIIHQSSATGMQAIPTTGIAQGIQYMAHLNPPEGRTSLPHNSQLSDDPNMTENLRISESSKVLPFGNDLGWAGDAVVICSLGDGSVTEGEVSEAFQFAVLKQLPIIYLVQDNEWGISATAEETRAMNAYEYADGFKGLSKIQIDGTDFTHCYKIMGNVINEVRRGRRPWLVH